MTLNDLTKEELLELLVNQGLNRLISVDFIKGIRWKTIIRKAKEMSEAAIEEMEKHKGPQNFPAYKKAHDKFDRAMKLYEEADKLIERQK